LNLNFREQANSLIVGDLSRREMHAWKNPGGIHQIFEWAAFGDEQMQTITRYGKPE
jgi:hypothetical protein